MAGPPLSLLFLWHHHQPLYKDPLTGEYRLPWVRLHGVNAYYSMARVAREFPELSLTFNLVPSLLCQLHDYAAGTARDPWLSAGSTPAEDLTNEERAFLLHAFFMADAHTMIQAFPRYRELFSLKGSARTHEECLATARRWTTQQCRDLQVSFHLAWTSPLLQEEDPVLLDLIRKERGYSEDDKAALFSVHQRALGEVTTLYRELQNQGAVELSTSPFYHPILPLLVDNWIGRTANPAAKLPKERFQWPEDARAQIERAIDFHNRTFGRPPQGLWPSEGSVSEPVVNLAADIGLSWLATDEEIFHRSLALSHMPPMDPHQAAVIASAPNVSLFFRDHDLSDRIGFRYARMSAESAVDDLLSALYQRQEQLASRGGAPVVTIALDGENPWGAYPYQGVLFLRTLYRRILGASWLSTVTPSSFLSRHQPEVRLAELHPGSWINGDFNIWIGHPDDHRAWEMLGRARRALAGQLMNKRLPPKNLGDTFEALYAAEGSDWTWWYGDDHSSGSDELFDELFRAHIRAIYIRLGLDPPSETSAPISSEKKPLPFTPQMREIAPVLDGRITHYFEWLGAGSFVPQAGAIRAQTMWLKGALFGHGREGFYLRIDPEPSHWPFREGVLQIFVEGDTEPIQVSVAQGVSEIHWSSVTVRSAIDECIEVMIPRDRFSSTSPVRLALALLRDGNEIDRLPTVGFLELPVFVEENAESPW